MSDREPDFPELTPLDRLSEKPVNEKDEIPKGYARDITIGLCNALWISRFKQMLVIQRMNYGNTILQQIEKSHRTIKKIQPAEKFTTITELLMGPEERLSQFKMRKRERRGWLGRFIRRIRQAL